jgi:hypothetical protein
LRPDIRDLHSIGVYGKLLVYVMMSNSAPRSMGTLFDNGLDRRAVCRIALVPPASGVDRTH